MVYYPVLITEIAKREIQKKSLAACIGVCYKTFANKMKGKAPFTWPEAQKIQSEFFPDIQIEELFATADEIQMERRKKRENKWMQ